MPEQTPRNKAIQELHSGHFWELPDRPPVEPGSVEALQFIEMVREQRFAALAAATDVLLARTLERGPTELIPNRVALPSPSPWISLENDLRMTFSKDIQAVERTPEVQHAQAFALLMHSLNPSLRPDATGQLMAGSITAIDAMLKYFRNHQKIMDHHDPEQRFDRVTVARRSLVLPGRLAMTCVNRMVAARETLVDNTFSTRWHDDDVQLNPARYQLHPTKDGQAIVDYYDLPELAAARDDNSLNAPIVECHSSKIIGCPITLLRRRLHQLWNWKIDIILERDLWGQHSTSEVPAQLS